MSPWRYVIPNCTVGQLRDGLEQLDDDLGVISLFGEELTSPDISVEVWGDYIEIDGTDECVGEFVETDGVQLVQ